MGIIESWAGIVAAHTYVVGAVTCAVVGAASAVVMIADGFSFDSVLLFDWFISADPRVIEYETVLLGLFALGKSLNLTARSQLVEVFDCCGFQILYEARSREVLSIENVKAICEFEKLFLQHPDYPLFCLTTEAKGLDSFCVPQTQSLASQFYDFSNATDCSSLTENRYNETVSPLISGREVFFLGDDRSIARSLLNLAGPLGADTTKGNAFGSLLVDQTGDQFEFYADFFANIEKSIFASYNIQANQLFNTPYNSRSISISDDIEVRYYSTPLYGAEVLRLADSDVAFVTFAIALVYVFSYFHVRSHFLCIVAITLIMQSLVVGIFVYKYVLGIEYFTTVSMLVLFLILGIGADGFYVITDAWVQSEDLWKRTYRNIYELEVSDLIRLNKYRTGNQATEKTAARIEFTLRRASASIFFTTITTVVAFIATATSPLLPMRTFGIFAAIVLVIQPECVYHTDQYVLFYTSVSANSIWVVTAYPVVLVIYDRKVKDKSCCRRGNTVEESLNHGSESVAKSVAIGTDTTVKESEDSSEESDDSDEESDDSIEGRGGMDGIMEDLEMSKSTSEELKSKREVATGGPSMFTRGYLWLLQRNISVHMCGCKLTLHYVALMLAILSSVSAGFLCTYATYLSTPTGPDETLHSSHMFYGFGRDFRAVTKVGSAVDFSSVQLSFGFDGLDRGAYDEFNPSGFRGSPIYKADFNPFSSAAQQFLLNVCLGLKQINCTDAVGRKHKGCIRHKLVQEDTLMCVMTEFHEWYSTFATTPINVSTPVSLFVLGDTDTDLVKDLFLAFATGQVANSSRTFFRQVGIIDGELRFITIDFLLNLANGGPAVFARPILETLQRFVEGANAQAPTEVNPITLAAYELVWLVTSEVIVDSLFRGLFVCFPFAFVILVCSTFNLLVALLALITIVFISLSCLGFIKLLGWALGIGEVMLGIMIIGLSVDYVIHLGHMYTDGTKSGKHTRAERLAYSVNFMLDTVIAAWLTTTISALVLMFASANFFVKMAILISSAISFSLLYSMTFFLPVLLLMGPSGTVAQLPYCLIDCCTTTKRLTRASFDARRANLEFVEELTEIRRQEAKRSRSADEP